MSISPEKYTNNPWSTAYWFARMLINSDQYGGLGKNSKHMLDIASTIQIAMSNYADEDGELEFLKNVVMSSILSKAKKGTKRGNQIETLSIDVSEKIQSLDDVKILAFTCANLMVPINNAISNIPNNDKRFAETISKAYLDQHRESGVKKVINVWDSAGIEGFLNAERLQIIKAFGALREQLERTVSSSTESDIVLTAFVQEFERRVGQKRKSRGGRSLEDVTSFILNYFDIPTTHAPDHFQADIEVDKWIRTSDKWFIGISCKRTLRERWKQVSSADRAAMGRYKIKSVWHVVTHAHSLSEDMLALLGANNHIFYLPDDNAAFISLKQHTILSEYVRPLTKFIDDLRQEKPRP